MSHHYKKSEEQWYTKRRNKRILIAPERHLILCQGEKTEPNYFEEIKKRINERYKGKITISVQPSKNGRLALLEEAERIATSSEKDVDHIWLVFDKDDFNKDEFDNTVFKAENLNKKANAKYHVLWSNQCIEVWFLLHLIDLKVDVKRKEYIQKINDNWKKYGIKGEYTKNDKQIYNKLEKYQNIAVERAKRIILENKGKAPSQIAPASMIYELIEMLRVYLELEE